MVTRKQGAAGAAEAARAARRIQTRQEAADAQAAEGGKSAKAAKTPKAAKTAKAAVQAGARPQPTRFPAQRLAKPGREADLALAPRYDAPDYRGSGKLAGFAALVTGADSGIGRAVAVLFAREGADVGIAYLDEHEDAQVTLAAVEAEGRRGLLLPGDVRDADWCESAVAATVEAFGRLDVLVNNAAFQMHAATIDELDDERLDLTFRTNIFGYFHMAKAALPHMREGGSIVNTGSVTGLKGSPQLLDYSATKGAIHAFTKSLAGNVIDRGIRVNCVAPGPVWTPLNPADKAPDEVATFGADTQMKRAAQPEEIAPAYVFLASPACAGYITGIVLPITGSVGAI
jgi:NAD(P)-dependent dehydrogenase (short-subunit alcohol dehydrogenase family)